MESASASSRRRSAAEPTTELGSCALVGDDLRLAEARRDIRRRFWPHGGLAPARGTVGMAFCKLASSHLVGSTLSQRRSDGHRPVAFARGVCHFANAQPADQHKHDAGPEFAVRWHESGQVADLLGQVTARQPAVRDESRPGDVHLSHGSVWGVLCGYALAGAIGRRDAVRQIAQGSGWRPCTS